MTSSSDEDLWHFAELQLPYEPQAEDAATGFFGLFFFSWLNPVMVAVSEESIQSPRELPGPIERFRVLTTGRQLARALEAETHQRHAWDAYIGCRVTLFSVDADTFFSLAEDAESSRTPPRPAPTSSEDPPTVHTGVLKYVGYVHSFRTPNKLYAGIAWDTGYAPLPQTKRTPTCCGLRWWYRLTMCGCARRVPRGLRTRVYHDGTVGMEPLFSIEDEIARAVRRTSVEGEVVLATCEPVETVRLCTDTTTRAPTATAASSGAAPATPPPPPRPVSLLGALLGALGPLLWVLGPLRILVAVVSLASPLILKHYLRYLRAGATSAHTPDGADNTTVHLSGEFGEVGGREGEDWGEGLYLVFLFFASSMVLSLLFSKFDQMVTRCALTFRGALCAVVFEKCLTIAPKYLQLPSLNTGRIINMVSNDVQQAQMFCYLFWYTLCAPLQIGCATYMVCQMVGTRAAMAAVAVYAVFIPIELLLSRLVHFCYVKRISATDARLKRTEEFFAGIRTAKFMSWEAFFVKQIEQSRAEEMRWLRITQWMWTMVSLLTSFVPTLATAVMFVVLTFWSTDASSPSSSTPSSVSFLTPETIFPALSALALLEAPFSVIPVLLYGYVRFYIAMKRLAAFIECDDAQRVPPLSPLSPTAEQTAQVQASLEDLASGGERASERASQQLWMALAARFTGATLSAFQSVPLKPLHEDDETSSAHHAQSHDSHPDSADSSDGYSDHQTRTTTGVEVSDDEHVETPETDVIAPPDRHVSRASAVLGMRRTTSSMALPLSHSTHALHLDDGLALQRALEAAAVGNSEADDVSEEDDSTRHNEADDAGWTTRTGDSSMRTSQQSRRSRRRRGGDSRRDKSSTIDDFILTPLPVLHGVTADIRKGSLTVVVGATGSGRSTFLKSLLGAYEVTHGALYGPREVAYVSQPVWILSGTVRENITFFAGEHDRSHAEDSVSTSQSAKRLAAAVACTQLTDEITSLPCGLDTEIGQRGISLSGGQKARVNLARAVYADKELCLLDDPLSALDPHVGERVMRDCILGALAGKTRIMTTHQASLLHHADHIIYLKDGRVVFQGSYPAYKRFAQDRVNWDVPGDSHGRQGANGFLELAAGDLVSRVDLATLAATHSQAESAAPSDAAADDAQIAPETAATPPQTAGGNAEGGCTDAQPLETPPPTSAHDEGEDEAPAWVVQEERASGRVPWSIYKRYGEACGGLCMLIVVCLVFVLTECAEQSSSLFLSLWATHTFDAYLNQHACLYVYLACVCLGAFSFSVRYGVCLTYARRGAVHLHHACLAAVGHSKLAFFDRTPVGQLMNRFSRDVNIVDDDLQIVLLLTISMFVGAVANISLMLVSQYFIVIFLIPTALLFVSIARFYGAAARHVQRMANNANTPVLTHLQEIMAGRWVIHAFGKRHTFLTEALRRIDALFACDYMRSLGECWLNVRMSFVSSLLLTGMALLGVLSRNIPWIHVNVGMLSLSLSAARTLGTLLTRGVMSVADVEASMNSVERLLYCADTAEPEDVRSERIPSHGEANRQDCQRHQRGRRRRLRVQGAVSGFQAGSLEFRHVDMRYRDGLPLVLRDVSFAIAPGQKVGVVGRTGSGKSTLLLAFLRLVEICGGQMLVNGRDGRDYDLRGLRLLFSMIPQDPLLFEGTVRSNVDPFGESSDDAVWGALRHVGMAERVRTVAGGLDGRVQEGGSNFSVGQRQLLCLARALLKRGSAFLLMDEATANVDPALDRQIQQTVHRTFRDYTVVTIAHRLHTVAGYDKILLMDGGQLVEWGSPRALVSNETSRFFALVQSMGDEAKAKFYDELKH